MNEPLTAWRNKGGIFFRISGGVYKVKKEVAVFDEDDPLHLNEE